MALGSLGSSVGAVMAGNAARKTPIVGEALRGWWGVQKSQYQ
jgi:hypothetical protein